MIISKTPLRVSFLGGGTDFEDFYKLHSGAVISCAIKRYIYVSIKKQSELFNEKYRLNYSETELVSDLDKVKNPIIRECIRHVGIDDRLYISTIADIPASSGLGSSSSFCVGLLNALYEYVGKDTNRIQLAEEAAHIETKILKRPMGKQDHFPPAFGGINLYEFATDGSTYIKPLNLSSNEINLLEKNTFMFWTTIQRDSSSVLSEQQDNIPKRIKELTYLKNQAHDVFNKFSLDGFDLEHLAKQMNVNWEMKKNLATKINISKIDKIYQKLLGTLIVGGKISGAGGGGFLTLISKENKSKKLIEYFAKNGFNKFERLSIDFRGSQVINF